MYITENNNDPVVGVMCFNGTEYKLYLHNTIYKSYIIEHQIFNQYKIACFKVGTYVIFKLIIKNNVLIMYAV